mmetsp:Transcript_18448/g.24001  ORF Transcript_18448/g.24001 Transcript_18448/m.24001 type:complete len:240 (+) Transcript_18448:139-858(+)
MAIHRPSMQIKRKTNCDHFNHSPNHIENLIDTVKLYQVVNKFHLLNMLKIYITIIIPQSGAHSFVLKLFSGDTPTIIQLSGIPMLLVKMEKSLMMLQDFHLLQYHANHQLPIINVSMINKLLLLSLRPRGLSQILSSMVLQTTRNSILMNPKFNKLCFVLKKKPMLPILTTTTRWLLPKSHSKIWKRTAEVSLPLMIQCVVFSIRTKEEDKQVNYCFFSSYYPIKVSTTSPNTNLACVV